MRKIILLILVFSFSLVFLVYLFKGRTSKKDYQNYMPPSFEKKSVDTKKSADIDHKGTRYKINWIKIEKGDFGKISLYPNFDEKLSSSQILEEKRCRFLTSAGFYNKKQKPIGLFITFGKVLSEFVPNVLLNGVFYIDNENKVHISFKNPEGDIKHGLQTGPVLISEGISQKIKTARDSDERRLVLALTSDSLYFLAIYSDKAVFQGPYLSDLAYIIESFAKRVGENFLSAVNLDGGTASVFINKDVQLNELSNAGGFFCVN